MINQSLDHTINYLDAFVSQLRLIRDWNHHVAAVNRQAPQWFPGAGTHSQSLNSFTPQSNHYLQPSNQPFHDPCHQPVTIDFRNQPPNQFPAVTDWNSPRPEPVKTVPKGFPVVGHWNSTVASDDDSSRSPSPPRLPPTPNMAENEENPELLSLKKMLKALAIPFTDGIQPGRLNGEYRDMEGTDIPYQKFNCPTLTSFLREKMGDVLYLGTDKMGNTVVKAYMGADTAHVQALVRGQRKVSKKRGNKTAPARFLFNSHRRVYGQGSVPRPSGLAFSNRTVGGSKLNTVWSSQPPLNPNLAPRVQPSATVSRSFSSNSQLNGSSMSRPSTSRPTSSAPPVRTLTSQDKEKMRALQHARQSLSAASIPNITRRQIFSFLKQHHPEPVPVMAFSELWEDKYRNTSVEGYAKEFKHADYGFLTLFQALKSIPDIAVVESGRTGTTVSLAQAALERIDEDYCPQLPAPITDSQLPDLKSLKIEPGSSMPPPKTPPRMSAGRGFVPRLPCDDVPIGPLSSGLHGPPPLRHLGKSPAKPITPSPEKVIETEEELFEFLKKKTGIDNRDILEAMVTPEKTAFYERFYKKKEQDSSADFVIPPETKRVFETILALDTESRGIPVSAFVDKYKKIVGVDFDPTSLGFSSIMETFKAIRGLIHVSEKQEAVEVSKYPNATDDLEYHIYDAQQFFARHPEKAPQDLLFKFNPSLIDVSHKLIATFISLNGSAQLAMRDVESEYKRLFKEKLDPSSYHFCTLTSLVKKLMENIAQIVEVFESERNTVIFMKKDGLVNWFKNKWSDAKGLEEIKQIIAWSKKYAIDNCAIFPPSANYKDCDIQERTLNDDELTKPKDRLEEADVIWNSVVISAVSSPRSFWINLGKDRALLNEMADELDRFYNSNNSFNTDQNFSYSQFSGTHSSYEVPDFLVHPGMVVAVKFTADQTYQRGLVMNCDDLAHISVKYVDFGGSGTFPLKSLRLLNKYFVSTYPEAFGIKVALFGVCPPIDGEKMIFPNSCRTEMLKYSDLGRKIACAFLTRKYTGPPKSGLEGLRAGRVRYECLICDVTDEDRDIYVHEQLVKAGLAILLPSKSSNSILSGEITEQEVYARMKNRRSKQ